MAKVSELIEQARALEAQGDTAKALAIYQHVLPHLESMPAIKADLALKAGDLMLKTGDKSGALRMYETAGTQCAMHGSAKGALTVASKIQQAAPELSDVYLSLAGQMVKHGHAGPAVDVLIQHAKQANLQQMLQELEPLAGRPSDDVRPLVQMLLDVPADAPPQETPPPPPPRASRGTTTPGTDDLQLQTASLEDELASVPQPVVPPPSPPSPRVSTPSYESPPPLPEVQPGITMDVSPPTARETVQINLRSSQVQRAVQAEPPAELAEPPSSRTIPPASRTIPPGSGKHRAAAPRRRRGGGGTLKWAAILIVLGGIGGAVYYFHLLPAGLLDQVKTKIASIRSGTPASPDSVRPSPPPRQTAGPRRDTVRTPAGFPGAPPTVSGAPAAAPVETIGRQPPVRIQGLPITDFAETPTQFRVVQRQESGQFLLLTGKPLADTVGEPAVGEVRLDSLPGDTAVATTNFDGYLVTVRGVIAPAALQGLLLQLVSRSPR
jgi:hypothetical protein